MRFCLLFVSLFCSWCRAQETEIQITRGVEYSRVGGRVLACELVRPARIRGQLPLVLYFHGGAWRQGNYQKIPEVGLALARVGFAFASLDFRGSDEAIFPAPLEDARAAVRFFKFRGQNYSIDSRKLGVYGISTGGQIAALLAFTGSSVRALATQGAPSDLNTLHLGARFDWSREMSPLSAFLGSTPSRNRQLARRASPLFFADETAPPTLLLHGHEDDFVPLSQGEKLYQALKKAGVNVTFLVFENEGHSFKNTREKADAEVVKFFRAQLKP